MSGALALAASIAAMERSELRSLTAARQIAAPATIQDPLGLALDLLRTDSVERALRALDRPAIDALVSLNRGERLGDRGVADRLRLLALVGLEDQRVVALPEVAEALDGALAAAVRRRDRFGAVESASDTARAATRTADASSWFAPALTSVRRTAALLEALADRPAALGRRGTATVPAIRELAADTHGDPDSTDRLLAVVRSAGLAVPVTLPSRHGGERSLLFPVPAVGDWLARPLHERWTVLAGALIDCLDAPLRDAIAQSDGDLAHAVDAVLPEKYPLLPESALAAAAVFAAAADDLGLAVSGRLSPPALQLLAGDTAGAEATALRDFPSPVAGVYLQPDLSIVVPGPLPPGDERALTEIADAEQWGIAVTLRLSPASLRRALRDGRGLDEIRDLLARLSLTGIPQPLDYLLGDLERTQGATSPRPTPPMPQTGGTETVADATVRVGAVLDALVERVHAAGRSEPGTGELSRRLELAIRDRRAVRVIAAAGGEERSFTLLPVALTGGRLRATDEQAGVQRTLPLSAITAVEAA